MKQEMYAKWQVLSDYQIKLLEGMTKGIGIDIHINRTWRPVGL
jgi:hypothetical protein